MRILLATTISLFVDNMQQIYCSNKIYSKLTWFLSYTLVVFFFDSLCRVKSLECRTDISFQTLIRQSLPAILLCISKVSSNVDLYILRHGEAGRRVPVQSTDFDRTLTVAGKKEIEKISEALDALDLKLDRIVTSPLKRSYQTAEIANGVLKLNSHLEEWDELKPEGSRTDLYKCLGKFKQDSSILVVGHEPNLSMLIGDIICGNPNSRIILKKGGLARVHINSFAPKVSGELRWLLSPKLLKKLG